MKLFYTNASPYARSVRIVLREYGLEERVGETISHPFDDAPEFLASNPLGKVPCLTLDDGQAIVDSEVICAYLDRVMGSGRLGGILESDWALRTYYGVCSGLIDTLVLLRQEKVREQQELRSDFWWQRYQNAISRTLDYLNRHSQRLGDTLSLAHINLACALDYLNFRHPEINWRNAHGALVRLADDLEQRTSFQATRLQE
ncbi:glutathione S-transferase [Microbulbifer discodermiae]|uniref:glutathione S-transferase n=1 Tax=Microbulbifer sp. 2201CG32-9 TaxID=3232309 RepID=UPI00345C46EC